MESLHLLELPIILYLQNIGNWLTLPARVFTALGNEEFYFMILPALFWCIDFQLGIRVGVMLILTNHINSIFKLIFHLPRPYWISSSFKISISEPSFGLPSGHAQNAASLWGLVATKLPKKYSPFIVLVIFLIGLSRILLAVHFISDVISGWFIGGLLLMLFLKLEKPVKTWITTQPIFRLHILSIVFSLLLIALPFGLLTLLDGWTIPEAWFFHARQSMPGALPDPLNLSGTISIAGVWLGMSNGLLFLFNKYGEFDTSGSLLQKSLRYSIGFIGIIIIWYGLGKVFPRTDDFLGYSLRYIRYVLAGLWISYIAPVLFFQLKLAGLKRDNNQATNYLGG